MTEQWTVPAWVVLTGVAVVAVLALLVTLCLLQVRRAARHAEARTAALSQEVADLAAAAAATATAAAAQRPGSRELAADHPSYVITRLGDETEPEPAAAVEPVATLPPGAFADVVLREGALRSASLLHGVRRALAPETRSRIRAEMRREVKRQRKARRLETREALRAWQARQREQEPAA